MKAIIFNSGMGSRMKDLTTNNPKCLVKLYNGETILERQLRILTELGIKEFIITTGYKKEQIMQMCEKYSDLDIHFVENSIFDKTNYIYSMYNAREFLNDDMLVLHGDLVFNKKLIHKMLNNESKSLFVYNEKKELPDKDFKARVLDNKLREVSIKIFDKNCFAFQPFYKLSKSDIEAWKKKVEEFVNNGITTCYAEDALNEILYDLDIDGISYSEDYIEEIDNLDDYERVTKEIEKYDCMEQEVIISETISDDIIIKKIKDIGCKKIFVVATNSKLGYITELLDKELINYVIFTDFSSNPDYSDVEKGIQKINENNCDAILSIGGGSAIDVAKCIKMFMKNNRFNVQPYKRNNIKHIAIPTTSGTGSESTHFAVVYKNMEKYSISHYSLMPEIAILDYNFLKTLPEFQKKCTMLDAFSQAIESYWSKDATEESRKYSKNAINLIQNNVDKYFFNDEIALRNMMIAANYSGKAINIARTNAPHAMSYKLSHLYKIPHGQAVFLCLPYVWEYMNQNFEFKSECEKILEILNYNSTDEAILGLKQIYRKMNFEKINFDKNDIDELVNSVNIERLSNSPKPLSSNDIYEIYKKIMEEN